MLAGWSFPWGLRARLAELLLRGLFDTLDEGQYTEQRQELLSTLQVGGTVRFFEGVPVGQGCWEHPGQTRRTTQLLQLLQELSCCWCDNEVGRRAAVARPEFHSRRHEHTNGAPHFVLRPSYPLRA